ncbi:Protein kes1 [Paramyrothecium foliicola]|nr:Protein kes1 [Paramyrothecium foliicola]
MAAVMRQTPVPQADPKPSPSRIGDLVKFLSTLKGDLANITAPPSFLAPCSVVENPRCWAQRPDVFVAPALEDDTLKRSLLVLRIYLTGLRNQFYIAGGPGISIKKPLNAFLGEIFLASFTDSQSGTTTQMVSEQVSHHPPITAMHISSPEHGIRADGYARVEMTFSGSLNIRHFGHTMLRMEKFNEEHLLPFPDVSVRGFLSACLYPEIWGTYKITSTSGYISEITFSGAGFLKGKKKNYFEARVYHKDAPKVTKFKASGVWSGDWEIKDGATGEVLEKYEVDDPKNRPAPMEVAPLEEQDPWESRRAWKDVLRGIEDGDWTATSRSKQLVEEAQRRMRVGEKQEGRTWEPLLFKSIPGDEHTVFHRLAVGGDQLLGEAETKGVWRLKNENPVADCDKPLRYDHQPRKWLRLAHGVTGHEAQDAIAATCNFSSIGAALFFLHLLIGKLNAPRITRDGFPLRKPPNTLPIVGNGLKFLQPRQKLFDWFTQCINLYGFETLHITVPTLPPGVIITDPANLEFVFKNVDIFQKGDFFKNKLKDLFGDGILNADGELWKRQRKVGSQLLSTANLKLLVDTELPTLLDRSVRTLSLGARSGAAIDLDAVIQEITTGLMGKTIYGMEMHSKDEFSQAFDYVSGAAATRFQNPLWFLVEPFTGAKLRAASRIIKANGERLVSHAISTHKHGQEGDPKGVQHVSKNFLNALFENLGDEKLVADSAQAFLSAGRETMAQALAWTFYLLITHPDVADKLREMAQNALQPREPGQLPSFLPEQLDSSTVSYITAVFYESTRLYPPLPFQLRQAQIDTTLPDGTFLPKDSIIVWCPWSLSRSTQIWGTDANQFKPERWLVDGQFRQKNPGEFPVFHGGARQCLGKSLAEVLAVRIIATLLSSFDFSPAFEGEKTSRTHLTLPMDGGLEVYVRSRDASKPEGVELMDSR